ncbi:MAG: bifunctional oligoribonuclease/PAP phosphatase NrnA [Treponemataceae bacterium]|nr:bifunctional oligoribonuclease/PAP phosphatase NrnA [Treponemataceae bacterium]
MREITQDEEDNFKNFVKCHKTFVVAGHKEPDGDCIASSLGMRDLLKAMNKTCTLVNNGPFKRTETKKYEKFFSGQFGCSLEERSSVGLIIVDCSELGRLGEISEQLQNLDIFIVDHHKTSEVAGQTCPNAIIDSTAPAAACLVQLLYEAVAGPVPKETAEILFFGIATDTGFFRFLDTTSASVFTSTARLIEAGANPRTTYDYITGGKPYSTRKLLGVLLSKAERYYDGKLVITVETMEDTKKFGQDGRDSDALYSLLLACDEVEAVVFVRQETVSTCTLGFRSRGEVDVSKVAAVFGGGGHKNASGGSTQGTASAIVQKIKEEFSTFF